MHHFFVGGKDLLTFVGLIALIIYFERFIFLPIQNFIRYVLSTENITRLGFLQLTLLTLEVWLI